MTTLILATLGGDHLAPETARIVTAARALGGDLHLLVAGPREAAEAAADIEGVARVLHAANPAYAHASSEPLAALLVALAPGYDALVAPANAVGKDVMPRVAALLDVAQISGVTGIDAPDIFRRPIYAGNAIETLRATDRIRILTIRAAAFAAAETASVPAPIQPLDTPPALTGVTFVSNAGAALDRIDLASARTIVSGGRALGSAENFAVLLGPLAAKLDAALGASRAAVDAGYAPNDLQVGQTGKIVAPALYIAIGISGAIQHLAGMKDSALIVAINSDADAPIMAIADLSLVGDLFTIVPELIAALAPYSASAD